MTVQVNGVDTTDQTLIDFVDTASVTWANPSGGIIEATAPGGGSGTVTQVDTGNGLTGGPITGTGTISGVNAAADGATKGVAAFTASDFNATTGVVSLDYANGQKATSGQPGYLTAADWSTFNGKQAAGSYITALTADVTASGPGSAAATLATVNSNVGSFTNANITVNAKGLVTAAANGSGGSGSPGGSDTQLQYNNSSAFGGISGATSNGTAVTFSNGNIHFVLPTKLWLPAAGTNNGIASTIWDLDTSLQPTPGGLVGHPFLTFPNSGIAISYMGFLLPADWTSTGGIDIDLIWNTAGTSGDMKWFVLGAFNKVDGTAGISISFNTDTVVTTAPGTTFFFTTSTISGLNLTGATSANSMWVQLAVKRNPSDGSDTLASDVDFYGAMLTYRRQL